MKILLTGVAGFIGMHVARQLLQRGDQVIGLDNLNDYYDPALKQARLAQLREFEQFSFHRVDIADSAALNQLFAQHQPQRVIHLAAQAGVRYSLTNPHVYLQSNLLGFGNILEACRQQQVEHLVYASSSSVYGANTRMPFSVHDNVDHPVSLYAASKKANELMAHSYSHLYQLPTTGLRYFTVYGPWGRPDMAPWLFSEAIMENRPINVFNQGQMQRDFTYVDDIASGTIQAIDQPACAAADFDCAHPDPATSYAPYRVYNIGNHTPVKLLDFIGELESALGQQAIKDFQPLQPGDVIATYADISDLQHDIGFSPDTPLASGIQHWAEWYLNYRESSQH